MHELSVCQGMLSQVAAIAAEHGARAVTGMTVQIGPLSGVVPELLEQAFSVASAGTVAEGASLQLDSLPIRVHCESCGAETEATANRLLCGSCGDWHTRLLSGDELLLASVELETGKPS
jgi:hydrogenase nickel incorporation protein HypA/HybF